VAFAVYILASQRNGTLYVGQTEFLLGRVWEHRETRMSAFTSKHGVATLVWFEFHETRENARAREAQIKKWRRAWKVEMIERFNPSWRDLYDTLEVE
jgi:putative endonuclease